MINSKLIKLKNNVFYGILLMMSFVGQSQNTIDFTLKYNSSLSRYEVYARPNFSQTNFTWGPSQISIVTPASVADNVLPNLTSFNAGQWGDNSKIYAPSVQPQNDFHGVESGGALTNFVANQELLIFTFTIDGGCLPGLRLYNNGIDPDSAQAGMGGGDFSMTVDNGNITDVYNANYNNNGTNCLDAIDDNPAPISGGSAITNIVNVFGNDTSNGNAINPTDVILTELNPSTTDPLTLNPNGNVDVAANTPAGTYTLTYQICEVLNSLNCDTAVVTVVVQALAIVANDDTTTTPVNSITGQNNAINIYSNDTLNGVSFVPSAINYTVVSPFSTTNITVATNGNVSVAPNTPAGTYTSTYQICEALNPTNCDTAIITIVVQAAPIVANDDTPNNPTNGTDGATDVINVLTNDTLNGVPVNPNEITLTELNPNPNNPLTLNPDGTIDVAPNTPAGTYTLTYQICENANSTNCDTAIVTIVVEVKNFFVKVMLQGALFGTTNGIMRDDLRTNNVIPLIEPYTELSTTNTRFVRPDLTGSEKTTNIILNVSGNNAIVDWVFVELRDPLDNTIVLHTKAALVQKDGDVVESADGISPLRFSGINKSSYYIAIKHRNHIGAMTNSPIAFTGDDISFDFTSSAPNLVWNENPTFQGYEQVLDVSGNYALWGGNSNSDRKVKYTSTSNDQSLIFSTVIGHIANTFFNYNFDFVLPIYSNGDINMDAKVKYRGVLNDSNYIFFNLISKYLLNSSKLYNYDLLKEQIPN